MKSYAKPVVLANDEVAEGVYAGSGKEPNCWTVDPVSVQDWNGWGHEFEIRCKHSADVEHISAATTVTLTFSAPLIQATAQGYECSFSGKKVTITRTSLADSYKSGDTMSYKVIVQAADEATTKGITCTGATISCDKQVNVQGGGSHGE